MNLYKSILIMTLMALSVFLISCGNKKDESSSAQGESGNIILEPDVYEVHGIVKEIINDKSVIFEITNSQVSDKDIGKSYKVIADSWVDTDGEKCKFSVGDKAYFCSIDGGDLIEDSNGEEYWYTTNLVKE